MSTSDIGPMLRIRMLTLTSVGPVKNEISAGQTLDHCEIDMNWQSPGNICSVVPQKCPIQNKYYPIIWLIQGLMLKNTMTRLFFCLHNIINRGSEFNQDEMKC